MFSLYREPGETQKYQARTSFQPSISVHPFNTVTFHPELINHHQFEGKNSSITFPSLDLSTLSSSQNVASCSHSLLEENSGPTPFVLPIFDTPMLYLGNPQKYLFDKCKIFTPPNHYCSLNKPRSRQDHLRHQHCKRHRPFYKKKTKSSKRQHNLEKEMSSLYIDFETNDLRNKPGLKKCKTNPSKRLHQLQRDLDALRIDIKTHNPPQTCLEKRTFS